LSEDKHAKAWGEDNTFRNLDQANKDAPAPLSLPGKEDL